MDKMLNHGHLCLSNSLCFCQFLNDLHTSYIIVTVQCAHTRIHTHTFPCMHIFEEINGKKPFALKMFSKTWCETDSFKWLTDLTIQQWRAEIIKSWGTHHTSSNAIWTQMQMNTRKKKSKKTWISLWMSETLKSHWLTIFSILSHNMEDNCVVNMTTKKKAKMLLT